MTSRNSFFKLMKEDLRQRLWTIVLACIAFLLPIPIATGMNISNYVEGHVYNFANELAYPLGGESGWLVVVTIVGAMICAVSGFGYLFSKKKVDFFHSLPVKREKLFAVRYLNGVLIYLVPYLVMILISFALIAIGGHFETLVFTTAMEGIAIHLLGFLTLYTTFILCVTFVGNVVVFFAVSGWVYGITLVVLSLYTWFEEMFFNTYSYMGDAFTERLVTLRFLCPGYFYGYQIVTPELSMLLQQLVYTVVLVAITVLVYRVRSSEGAGKAIAFPILKPILRMSIEILAGACIGMMFYSMADGETGVPGWMIFGAVLGVVLSHILIQSIFHYDIRKCLTEKLSMAICVAVSIGFVLVMRYDVFGYDTYIPREKKIESVAIEVNGMDGYRDVYYYGSGTRSYVNEIDEMKLTDIAAVYPYLESLIEDTEYYYDRGEEDVWLDGHLSVNVAYRLKNGKTIYRRYMANGIKEELFTPVFENMEYKECHYADIYTMNSENLRYVTARHAMNEQEMSLGKGEREEFLTILRKELSAQTLDEKLNTLPVAIVELLVVEQSTYYDWEGKLQLDTYNRTHKLPIYASYTETLQFLADRGFTATKEYEWTGLERMWIEYPAFSGSDSMATYYENSVKFEYYDGSEYFYNYDKEEATAEVKKRYREKVYELCQWQDLFYYGDPTYDRSAYYTVYLEVPLAGYNNYETYVFYIDGNIDIFDLFE